MVKILTEMRALTQIERRGQVEENKLNKLRTKATTLLTNRNDQEWVREITGTSSGRNVDGLMTVQEDQFERVINWLTSRIDESRETITKQKKKIQSMYEDNQRKCLNHYVWPKTTPACPLTPEDFAHHYGQEWANEVEHYEDPTNTEEWNIDRTVGDNAGERFERHMTSEKKIKEIIATRNYISAHGKDGISNAIFRLAKKEASQLLSLIFKAIIITGHIPMSWKETKTIMIYKKDDPSLPKNWRPIGITSTMYHIFSATMASFILSENKRNPIFHKAQKGFIGGGNGAKEHINNLNEMIYHIRRNKEKSIMITIDLTNAFGSVPHSLFIDTLTRKGMPQSFIQIVKDIYTDNTTVIDVNGKRSEKVPIKRGVLQGCPLSPLLFNCCIDPLLTHIERYNKHDGISFEWEDKSYTMTTQAYADDLVLIANSKEAAERMINSLETYCNMTGLVIAPKKCNAIVEGYDISELAIKINETAIPTLNTSNAIQYLGAPITGRKATKLSINKQKIAEVKEKVTLVFNSPLTLSQKVHAIRTYVLPQLDYAMMNSSLPVEELAKLDSHIRHKIMKEVNTARIPKEYAHISSKFGGIGIPSMEMKSNKMKILSFVSQFLSNDEFVRAFAELNLSEEVMKRGITTSPEEKKFLNFQFGGETGRQLNQTSRQRGTNCAMIRAIEGAQSLDIFIQRDEKRRFLLEHHEETRRPMSLKDANQIIESFHQKDLLQNIRNNLTHGHSFTGEVTKSSNSYRFANAISDKLFKFIVKARTNTLPTQANVQRWFPSEQHDGQCKLCHHIETLNHILNSCHGRSLEYTWRHNIVAQKIANEIQNNFEPDMIKQSGTLEVEGISPENQRFRPDIVARIDNSQKYIIVEITIPYNQETCRNNIIMNTLKERQEEKEAKYRSLMEEVATITGYEVEYHTIIISSLGHVTSKTEQSLISLFGNKKGKKLSAELSIDAIRGSACIYYNQPPEVFGFTTNDKFPQLGNEDTREIPEEIQESSNSDFTNVISAQSSRGEEAVTGDNADSNSITHNTTNSSSQEEENEDSEGEIYVNYHQEKQRYASDEENDINKDEKEPEEQEHVPVTSEEQVLSSDEYSNSEIG